MKADDRIREMLGITTKGSAVINIALGVFIFLILLFFRYEFENRWLFFGIIVATVALGKGLYKFSLVNEKRTSQEWIKRVPGATAAATTEYCHSCGKRLGSGDKFCASCGLGVKTT